MGGGEQSALSDEGGRFRFDRLTPGRYTAERGAARPDERAGRGGADGRRHARTSSSRSPRERSLKGVVSGLADSQLTGVNVSASGQDYFASTRTRRGGVFELSGVPEGLSRCARTRATS